MALKGENGRLIENDIGGGTAIETSADFASISASTALRLIYVLVDETNNDNISLYLYNGTTLKFLQTIN